MRRIVGAVAVLVLLIDALGPITAPSIRGARVVPLPGGGHFPQRDAPDDFARAVDDFLD